MAQALSGAEAYKMPSDSRIAPRTLVGAAEPKRPPVTTASAISPPTMVGGPAGPRPPPLSEAGPPARRAVQASVMFLTLEVLICVRLLKRWPE